MTTATAEKHERQNAQVNVEAFIDPENPQSWSRQMVSLLRAGHYREGYEILAEKMPFVENMLRPYAERLAGQENFWTRIHDQMVAHLDLSEPRRVLDLGCAIGCHAIELARQGHETWGVDVLPVMIERGRELAASLGLADRVHLIDGDVRHLDWYLEPESLDAVIACDIFEHLDDDALRQVLEGIRGVLRPGGKIVVQTSPGRFYYWFEPHRWKLMALLIPMAWLPDRAFSGYVRWLEAGPLAHLRSEHKRFYLHEYGHINCMDHDHLRRLLEEAGMVEVLTYAVHAHPGQKDEGCMRTWWSWALFGGKSAACRNVFGVATNPD